VREPEQAREPGLVPELAQAQVREPGLAREPVRRASSAQPVQVQAPVCWLPAVRRVPDARRFFQKHSTRQSQG